jgi:hypothetical protein
VQTNLMHSLGDVGSSKHQVLESSCDALELGGVLYRRPKVSQASPVCRLESCMACNQPWPHAE